jgi:S-DNA-T family DNA segregation ATPase FtsK/SpoIIIE
MSRRQKNEKPTKPAPAEMRPRIANKVVVIMFLMIALLVLLSLVSYSTNDTDYLSGGVEGGVYLENWIGVFGAYVARVLFLVFGFAAYPLVVVCLASFARRLFAGHGLRKVGWEYWLSFPLVGVGGAMLFGIWPGTWPEWSAHLNIGQTPGGVVGQMLCEPESGWMRLVLNHVGSGIVAAALILVGFVVLWIYDWHNLFMEWWNHRRERMAAIREAARGEEIKQAAEAKKAKAAAKESRKERKARRRDAAKRLDEKLKSANQPLLPTEHETSSPDEKTAAKPEPSTAGKSAKSTPKRKTGTTKYELPPLELLADDDGSGPQVDPEEVAAKKAVLQETLDSFNVEAQVGDATSGPRVTLFEVEPAPGVKVERISNLSNNIAMELRAESLRILAPIPGKKSVGIEVPNTNAAVVPLKSLMDAPAWKSKKVAIPLLLGRNISGKAVVLDLARAPHLLIAGATGSGKSVCINAMIMSLMYRFSPEDLRLILVDPKVVEFSCYNTLPHLVVPVITETKKVPLALRWVINEMEKRYRLFAKAGARNIAAFNSRGKSGKTILDEDGNAIPDKVPYIVVVIDELADIMMTAKADVETSLARIAQLSRAVGIHTIIATQRPSVNVITGTIKANYPTRIAFQVTSQIDSRTILDGKGAEQLLGRGDMLFKPPGASRLERIQSPLVEDEEIDSVVEYVAEQGEQEFDPDVFKSSAGGEGGVAGAGELSEDDEDLIARATEVILQDRRATTSYVQRALRIGYNRAAMIMEILEERGVIGPQIGSSPREILISRGGDDEDAFDRVVDEIVEEIENEDLDDD